MTKPDDKPYHSKSEMRRIEHMKKADDKPPPAFKLIYIGDNMFKFYGKASWLYKEDVNVVEHSTYLTLEKERDAYKKAKEENDERFQLENAELKRQLEERAEYWCKADDYKKLEAELKSAKSHELTTAVFAADEKLRAELAAANQLLEKCEAALRAEHRHCGGDMCSFPSCHCHDDVKEALAEIAKLKGDNLK